MSPAIQGENQVILSTANVPEGQGIMGLTVLDITMGFLPKGEILMRPDASNMQIIRVNLRAANVGTKDVNFRYDGLSLHMKNGTQGRISFYVNQQNTNDFLQSKLLKPGDATEGAVYFELPATAVRSDLVLEYKGKEKTTPISLLK